MYNYNAFIAKSKKKDRDFWIKVEPNYAIMNGLGEVIAETVPMFKKDADREARKICGASVITLDHAMRLCDAGRVA